MAFPLYENGKLLYNTFDIENGVIALECMRCGKKTEDKNVFCPECLAEMENYPVKPGAVIHIPTRRAPEPNKPRKKKEKTLEEQLVVMRQAVRVMTACVLGLMGALILTGVMLFYALFQPQDAPDPPMTRNYSTSTPAETD